MKNIVPTILMIGLVFTVFTSCKKNKEPVIEISSPLEHSDHKWGDEVHIMSKFTDESGLKNYTIIVGDEAGTHDHSFGFMKSGEITDLSYEFHDHFMVPDNCEMKRWIHFTVVDVDGNSINKKWMVHFEE